MINGFSHLVDQNVVRPQTTLLFSVCFFFCFSLSQLNEVNTKKKKQLLFHLISTSLLNIMYAMCVLLGVTITIFVAYFSEKSREKKNKNENHLKF